MKNICESNGCKELGKYKAPMEKDNIKNFKWLCENHIKIFNKNWNYFDGMSQNEIDIFLKSDVTWHKPTQNFASADNFFNILWNNTLNDDFKFLGNGKYFNNIKNNKLSEKDKDAFLIMNLGFDADWKTIQKRFKTLVKKFHPDKNAGNKLYEDKLKKITLAYSHLKKVILEKK